MLECALQFTNAERHAIRVNLIVECDSCIDGRTTNVDTDMIGPP
jgi:hypothetical protein